MSYKIDLENSKTNLLAPLILNIFNEGKYFGKNVLKSEQVFRALMGRRPTFRSEYLLFMEKFRSVRGFLRRKSYHNVWITTRTLSEINRKGTRVKKFAYSIAQKTDDYEKAEKVIDEMIDHLMKGKEKIRYKIEDLREQTKLKELFLEFEKENKKNEV